MVFGISTACFFPDMFTEDAINAIGSIGVKNAEVFFSCMSEYGSPYIDEFKKRILANGMSAYSVHALSMQFEPQLFSPQKRARQEAEDILQRVLEAGAKLGAGVYVFHGPANIKHTKRLNMHFPFIAETAARLAETAAGFGIKLAWENVHWCWFSEPSFALELIKQPGTENLYFTLDIKQAAQAGYDPADFVEAAGGRLINVHVCDYGYGGERGVYPMLPFAGNADFINLREALRHTGFDGGMMLEVYRSNFKDNNELADNFNKVVEFFSSEGEK